MNANTLASEALLLIKLARHEIRAGKAALSAYQRAAAKSEVTR